MQKMITYWTSQQCGSDFLKCCLFMTDITVRVCRAQGSNDEDVALTELEL